MTVEINISDEEQNADQPPKEARSIGVQPVGARGEPPEGARSEQPAGAEREQLEGDSKKRPNM